MQGNSSVNNPQSYNAFYSPFGEGNIPYNISNLASLGINPFINISLPSALNGQAIDFTSAPLHSTTTSPSVDSSTTRNQFPGYSNSQAEDSRHHPMTNSQREAKWLEIRRYSDFIRRFSTESTHNDINKDNYYDLYNMAVCLLKAIDSLDPESQSNSISTSEKEQHVDFQQQSQISNQSTTSTPSIANFSASQNPHVGLENLSTRESFDYYYNRGVLDTNFWPKYQSTVHSQQSNISPQSLAQSISQNTSDTIQSLLNGGIMVNSNALNTLSSGVYQVPSTGAFYSNVNLNTPQFSNPSARATANKSLIDTAHAVLNKSKAAQMNKVETKTEIVDDKKGKKRRRRIGQVANSNKRNLRCHMCGVTETPEWRRGPAGDHTLCNACGLHYAKSLKKQRKERESRKHSVDLLLNPMEDNSNKNSNESSSTHEPTEKSANESSNQQLPSHVSSSNKDQEVETMKDEVDKESEESESESESTTPTSENVPPDNKTGTL